MDATTSKRLGEGVLGSSGYRHVYADSRERFTNKFGSRNPIRYGDRLFTRIVMRGRTIMEFIINEVCDLTELLMELRKKTKGLKGLVQVYIRNYSQGWSTQQPLMLYAGSPSPLTSASPQPTSSNTISAPSARMPFPWETH